MHIETYQTYFYFIEYIRKNIYFHRCHWPGAEEEGPSCVTQSSNMRAVPPGST